MSETWNMLSVILEVERTRKLVIWEVRESCESIFDNRECKKGTECVYARGRTPKKHIKEVAQPNIENCQRVFSAWKVMDFKHQPKKVCYALPGHSSGRCIDCTFGSGVLSGEV